MIPLTPSFLIAAASSLVGVREEGGNNCGQMVERFLRGVTQPPGQPWCAAFVHHIGYWSHFDYKSEESTWPLPATASCYALGEFARREDILREEPQAGDIFLLWKATLGRFAHTGVIVGVRVEGETPAGSPWFDCDSIEGNTDLGGSRDGDGVLRRVRRFYPQAGDRFIRWADLDGRRSMGQPPLKRSTTPRVA